MIKKFIKISGTGKFLNYQPGIVPSPYRTTDFERINLIYGENGSGKTTLSIILKSLKNDNNILTRKRAFDVTVPQEITILTDSTANPTIQYSSNAWNNHYPNLEIFDIHFVNDNIYTGLEIQNTHKKNLFEVVFGTRGIILKTEIQDLKERIQSGNTIQRQTITQIETIIGNTFNAIDYCCVNVDPEIDTKISNKTQEIITARVFQEILIKPNLSEIPEIEIPYSKITAGEILKESIDSISEEYLERFKDHTKHLSMNGNEEEWIKQGYEVMEDECPFCKRPIDDSIEIVEAYKQYFNAEYNTLISNITEIKNQISNFNLQANLLQIETKITSNKNLIDFWKSHVTNFPVLNSLGSMHEETLDKFDALKQTYFDKSANPIQAKSVAQLEAFNLIIDNINSRISEYNVAIQEYNPKITELKTSTQPNVIQLEAELKKLEAIKKRDIPNVNTLCTSLLSYSNSINQLNTQKDTKQQELDTYSTTIFSDYADKINAYLQAFAPYLEIRNLDSGYVGSSKEPMVKYALHISGNEIRLDDNAILPTFKYSLSEGDKSALALAFFLTKLEVDGNLQDKIIVFDDPVSSFDLNRKSTTINKLLAFGQQAKQLFVFTHNIVFAGEFWKTSNQTALTTQCSKLEYIGTSSCIVEFDIDSETLTSIIKDSKAIQYFLSNGALSDQERRSIARCLRPALESYFHLKFFDLVGQNDWLGDFISKVRTATNPSDRFYRLQNSLSELSDINDYSKKYHHRFNLHNDSEPVNDAELGRNYCMTELSN